MSAYYNEHDPKKAAVLRELIKCGVIAPGDVDERSVEDVRADELAGFRQCHFFAGAGIWSYALRLAGWPDDRPIWTGSCPCPSFSAAGKGEGFEDARHLWPAWYRLISECGPATIFGEQVEAAIGFGWIDLVQTDLEAQAYAFGKIVLGACSVGAPHIRLRVYFVADSQVNRAPNGAEAGKSNSKRLSAIVSSSESTGGRRASRRTGKALSGKESRSEIERPGNALCSAESMHAERRSLNEHRKDGRDGQDGGWAEAHRITRAPGEVCERSDPDGGNADAEGLQRSGEHGLRTQDGCSTRVEGNGEQPEVDDSLNPNSARPFQGRKTSETTGHRGSTEPASSAGDSSESERERLEGHFGNVRKWRGPGWLDPITARSVAQAGATRGFWADCDWWYGRDGKYRPIGAGLFPLAHGAPARVVRLRCYGDGIVPQVAQAFIEAYMSLER